jgi:hypothetical protein
MSNMKIATGTVTPHGTIVVEGPEEKRLLLESIAQADRGEFVDADDLLAELDESN